MGRPEFHELEHTADWALQIKAATLSQLFHNAALGMLELMGVTLMGVSLMGVKLAGERDLDRQIEIEAFDLEELLVAWLEELLYGVEMRSVGIANLNVAVEENSRLIATFVEVPIQSIEKEIKAVTFHALEVKETSAGVEATVVFDV